MALTTGKSLTLVTILAGISVAVSVSFSLMVARELNGISGEAALLRHTVEEGRLAQDLQLQVANIWQFITDASLVRERKSIEEGARPAYEEAGRIVARLASLNHGDRAHLALLDAVRCNLPTMWDTGNRMFQAYQRDWQQGSRLMGAYDQACSKVIRDTAAINEERKVQTGEAIAGMAANSARASRMVLTAMILVSLSGVAVVVSAVLVRRKIMAAITGLNRVAAEIETGNLMVERDGLASSGSDELERLKRAFCGVVARFHDVVDRVLFSTTKLSGSIIVLKNRTERTTEGASTQSGQAAQIATAAEQMSMTISDISRNTAMVSEVTGDALRLAEGGKEVSTEAVRAINRVRQTSADLDEMVRQLGSRVAEIGDIVGMISDIADQTNLLALNAAIEAARAGEQGRGFAVVADEVRALAERTIKATKEITVRIAAVQNESRRTSASMASASGEVERATGFIGQVGTALDGIVDSVQSVRDKIVQIATAVEEQSATATGVADNIEQTSRIAGDLEQMATETRSMASELVVISEALRNDTAQYKTKGSRDLIFELAKSDHQVFVGKIAAALRGDISLDPATLPDHHNCRLGKWYFGPGMERCGSLASFRDMASPHERIHLLGKEALESMGRGDGKGAAAKLAEMEQISSRIVSLLDATKEECRNR